MKTILKNSDQLPGLVKIIAIPTGNIASIVGNVITVLSDNEVYLLQASIDSVQHNAVLTDDDNGKFFAHTVSAVLHGRDEVSDQYLQQIAMGYSVVLLQKDDASWYRIGDKENAMSLLFNFDTSRPGYTLEFSGALSYKSAPVADPDF